MFPWVYGFTWDAGNIIFLGLFLTVALVIGGTLALALIRAIRDLRNRKADQIRWREDFHDLPTNLRICRHQITGELAQRVCPHAFDCRECELHPVLIAKRGTLTTQHPPLGVKVPADRYYHRGHAWVKPETDGTMLIGLDDFGTKVFGKPDAIVLPQPGSPIAVNGTAWTMQRNGTTIRILSPIDGRILETGDGSRGWFLKVVPRQESLRLTHLLSGDEAAAWISHELDRLKAGLHLLAPIPLLADGGELVRDLPAQYPEADWNAIWGKLFLEP